jgi:hypothetical protein
MAYLSKNHPRQFAGQLSPWARSAASFAFTKLVEAKSHVPFLCTHENSKPCMIVPEINPDRVRVTLLYGVRRSALSPNKLAAAAAVDLVANWRGLARAFVVAELNPTLVGIDHNATVRAANELIDPYFPYLPTLPEIDYALGTMLESVNVQKPTIVRMGESGRELLIYK